MVSQHICSALLSDHLRRKGPEDSPGSSLNPMECFAGISDLNHNPPHLHTHVMRCSLVSGIAPRPDFTYLANNPFLTSSGVTEVLILSILSIC